MDETTRNTLLALVGAITLLTSIIGGIVSFVITRLELQAQRKEARELAEKQRQETRELTKLTSSLQTEVNRLSRSLDQSIYNDWC